MVKGVVREAGEEEGLAEKFTYVNRLKRLDFKSCLHRKVSVELARYKAMSHP